MLRDVSTPPDGPDEGTDQPVSMDKPGEPEQLDFDPYRFGAPDHPIPPEYAPPGYRPPPPPAYPAAPTQPPGRPGQQPGPPGPPLHPYAGGPVSYTPGPPPPYGMPYPPPRRTAGKAITSLVLGIGSIVLSILSIFDIVLIALAVIFGVLALVEANRSPGRPGRGMAIAGLVCATVGAVLAVLLTVWFVGAARHCTQYDNGSSQFQNCFRDHL